MRQLALLGAAFLIGLAAPGLSDDDAWMNEQQRLMELFEDIDPDTLEIDESLPVPELDSLPEYYADTAIDILMHVYGLVDSTLDEIYYRVEQANDPSFGNIEEYQFLLDSIDDTLISVDTLVPFTGVPEDTHYFRAYSIIDIVDTDTVFYRSRYSNVVSVITDTTRPVLDTFAILGDDDSAATWTSTREVEIWFSGKDEPFGACGFMELTEDAAFGDFASIPISTCIATVSFELSPVDGTKTVYGRLRDKAGNTSDSVSYEIVLSRAEQAHSYPNPFNPDDNEMARMVYTLRESCDLEMYIYDLMGNLVYSKSFSNMSPGLINNDEFCWNGRNDENKTVASGGYICVLKCDDEVVSRHKIAVLR